MGNHCQQFNGPQNSSHLITYIGFVLNKHKSHMRTEKGLLLPTD